jgi:hypothetical protein
MMIGKDEVFTILPPHTTNSILSGFEKSLKKLVSIQECILRQLTF